MQQAQQDNLSYCGQAIQAFLLVACVSFTKVLYKIVCKTKHDSVKETQMAKDIWGR